MRKNPARGVVLDEFPGRSFTETFTREYLSAFLDIDQLLERVDVTFRECDSSEFTLCGFDIKTCGTAHSAAGFAYRIDGEFTFSGDTEASESVVRFADGSSVLVHDCAYYDEEETNHATPHQLGQTIAAWISMTSI